MPTIPGSVRVGGFIAPSLTSDPYATHEDTYGKGGFRPVADAAARDLITEERRKVGMLVYCIAEAKYYQCTVATTPPTWVEASMGGSGAWQLVPILASPHTLVEADGYKIQAWSAVDTGLFQLPLLSTLTDGWWVRVFNIGSGTPAVEVHVDPVDTGLLWFINPWSDVLVNTNYRGICDFVAHEVAPATFMWIAYPQAGVWTDMLNTLNYDGFVTGGSIGRVVNLDIDGNIQDSGVDMESLLRYNRSNVASTPRVVDVSDANTILAWTGANNGVFTLPTSNTAGAGFRFRVRNEGTGTHGVTINTVSGNTISLGGNMDGGGAGTSLATTDLNASVELVANGATSWYVTLANGTWTDGTITRHFDAHIPGGTLGNLVAIDAAGDLVDSGISGAISSPLTMYVDGDIGDDANDGLAWLTAKKTFGFLIGTATDALPKQINAAFTCYFRNDIRARDADGHFVVEGFYGSGSMEFIGTLTAVETLTATTYENDGAVQDGRIWVNDPTKAWTPGQYRRYFIKVGADPKYYPIYANTGTKLWFPVGASLTGTPACTIYSVPELLGELESDPGVVYVFGTWPTNYLGVRSCTIPITISNLWLDEAVTSWYDQLGVDHVDRITLNNIAASGAVVDHVGLVDYWGCYFDLWDYRYVFESNSASFFYNCVFDSTDSTGWGYNVLRGSSSYAKNCIFVNQLIAVYNDVYGILYLLDDVVFRTCDIAILLLQGNLGFSGGYYPAPQVRFDTCTTCVEGNGIIAHWAGQETAVWSVANEILIGETDSAEFSELNARTLQSRVDLSVLYMESDTTPTLKDEYDNTTSGLTAVRYQTAIDEIVAAGGGGVNLATFGVLAVDLIDDTDFDAVEAAPYVTEGVGYMLEVVPTTATGDLTIILYQDVARLEPIYTMVVDLSDADTYRSAEAFGFELETIGTIYGTAFVVGVPVSQTVDILVTAGGFQPAAPPPALPSPYGDGIEDDGLGKPRVAFPSDGGFAFSGGKLELKPDLTADVYPTLSAAGVAIANAVTTTTDEDIVAKKRFTAVGMDPLAAAGPPVAGTYLLGHEVLDDDGIKWRCTVAGTPGSWELADSVADAQADYATATLIPGEVEILEILTTGDVGTLQMVQVWAVVDDIDDYSTDFRLRIYQTSDGYGRDVMWQASGVARQSYLTAILPAAQDFVEVNDEDMFDTDEACVVYEDDTRYELARILARSTGNMDLDEVLVDGLSWAADTKVCSVAEFDNVPFRNTDGTPASRGRAFLQVRNNHAYNSAIFYVRVLPLNLGVLR